MWGSGFNIVFKDTLNAFHDFKNKQKSVWSNALWYVQVCIFWKCIPYTIHWNKTQTLKKTSSNKINGAKNVLFFFTSASSNSSQVSFIICIFYMSWSKKFVSLKLCVECSILDSVLFLFKFLFWFNEIHRLFDFKTS